MITQRVFNKEKQATKKPTTNKQNPKQLLNQERKFLKEKSDMSHYFHCKRWADIGKIVPGF